MTTEKSSKGLNIALWVVQVLTAALMALASYIKIATPIEELSLQMKWTGEVPSYVVRLLGLIDLLGGVGVILPALLKIKPGLTSLAATGVVLLMICAIAFHVSRGESSVIGFNIMIMVMAGFVAWGRNKKLPIQAK
jgi:hypothetical protein